MDVPMTSPAADAPIGISLGDPAGIGPEIVVRALEERPQLPLRVYGAPAVLAAAAARLKLPAPPASRVRPVAARGEIVPGRPILAAAHAQLEALQAATDDALAGRISALCTAPISKDWIARAGFTFPGHTEYLARRCGTDDFAMMLAGPRLRVVLATTHLALADVPRLLRASDVARASIQAARALLRDFGLGRPRVAVAALNPHAGEARRFGDEEARIIVPGIAAARAQLAREQLPAEVSGPRVPDAVYRQAALGAYDAVIAPYHDQGLIPVKLLHFDEGVNVTLGLPFVRTSPDHGTAYDIAGSVPARANPGSFLTAQDQTTKQTTRLRRNAATTTM